MHSSLQIALLITVFNEYYSVTVHHVTSVKLGSAKLIPPETDNKLRKQDYDLYPCELVSVNLSADLRWAKAEQNIYATTI